MFPRLLLAALVALVAAPSAGALLPPAGHVHDDPELIPDVLIVTYDPGLRAEVQAKAQEAGARIDFLEFLEGTAIVHAGEGRGSAVEERLLASEGFLAVDHDRKLYAHLNPNDPRFPNQYGPQQVRAPAAWDITLGSHAVKIAVMDTGIHLLHEDLVANLCGSAVFTGEASVQDNFGHGTHVAGIAAAALNNAKGIAGMSNSCILAAKVLDGNGVGSFSWLVSGVNWAVGQGARVITMSLGAPGNPGSGVENALNAAFNAGAFLDASAGNDGCPQLLSGSLVPANSHWPGAYAKVMSTGATNSGEFVDSYSNCGLQLDISAPGTGILSAVPPCTGGVEICSNTLYASISGTSMAAPHVAGAAALMFAIKPALKPRDVFCTIAFTAQRINAVPWDPTAGWGEVDALDAVKRARDGPPIGQGAEFGQFENTLCDRMLTAVPVFSSVL